MKIGIICYPTFGGSGIIATELGMYLAIKKNYEVHFISYKKPVRLNCSLKNICYHKLNIKPYPLFDHHPYEFALSNKIVEVVKKFKLDILHVHYAIPHALTAIMAKQILKEYNIKTKIVTTLHGTDISLIGSHPSYKEATRFSINNSDIVTCVSKSLAEETISFFNPKKKINVINNFINMKLYENIHLKLKDKQISDDKIITHMSNFRKLKKINDVIDTFSIVIKKSKKKVKLFLIGEGPEKEEAKVKVKKLKIENHVKFMGNLEKVEEILFHSDILLIPSAKESFGLSALEAMAAKNAIISTNIGGLPELNLHKKTGFLSNLGDVEDMSKNIISLIENDELLEEIKNNSFNRAKEFDIEKIVPNYISLYKKIEKC